MRYKFRNMVLFKLPVLLAFTVTFVLSCSKISYSSNISLPLQERIDKFRPVINKLAAKGVDSNIVIQMISDSQTQFNEKYVKINVTGYLKKPDYSHFSNEQSVSRNLEFLKEHESKLIEAEAKYSVPKEVIASILWIETKHGNFLGSNHIISVYLSTALANEQKYIDMNIKELEKNFEGDSSELAKLKDKIIARANKKANWALNELIALKDMKLKNVNISKLKGSWAGAFGMPQFLPSSYLKLAVDGNNDGNINLFDVDDAIFSVANYLNKNGWSEDVNKQSKAVFSYNNSADYVQAVLKLAELSK